MLLILLSCTLHITCTRDDDDDDDDDCCCDKVRLRVLIFIPC
jgi:hypothetical protein